MTAAEYTFTLPIGLVSPDGRAFQQGGMRLATALDEIEPLGDERVRSNEAYYGLLLLARVVTWLGPYRTVTPELIASLAALDFAYLQDLYGSLNSAQPAPVAPAYPAGAGRAGAVNAYGPGNGLSGYGAPEFAGAQVIETECPHCHATLELDLSQGHAE